MTTIAYGQCWEDADVLLAGLNVREGDTCLSIGSAGDNTLALLTRNPERVIAVDCNPAQIACLELRVAGYLRLEHREFLELYGSRSSERRLALYTRCRGGLSAGTRAFWDARSQLIARGIGHAGRFEQYLELFRRRMLPLVHDRRDIERLLRGGDAAECRDFYAATWDSWRWRALFRVFFSRALMAWLGRHPDCFAYAPGEIADVLLSRARATLASPDIAHNAYLHWILRGQHLDALPFALRAENYAAIRANLGRLEWHCERLETRLARLAARSVDHFNLSNVFEYLPAVSCAATLAEVARVGRSGGRALYWNLFVERSRPPELAARLIPQRYTATALKSRARTFFYHRLVLEQISH